MRSRSGNRRVSRFAKKQLLVHGVIRALRLGFNVVLVNPKGTTNSEEHDRVMRERGFDRHMASAYLIALKGLGITNDINFTAYRKLLTTAIKTLLFNVDKTNELCHITETRFSLAGYWKVSKMRGNWRISTVMNYF